MTEHLENPLTKIRLKPVTPTPETLVAIVQPDGGPTLSVGQNSAGGTHMQTHTKKDRGFTLVELLIVTRRDLREALTRDQEELPEVEAAEVDESAELRAERRAADRKSVV